MTVRSTSGAKRWLAAGIFLALVPVWTFVVSWSDRDASLSPDSRRESPKHSEGELSSPASISSSEAGSSGATSLAEEIRQTLRVLRGGGGHVVARQALARLKQTIHAASPSEAAAALISALESGEDGPTGLAFVVGPDGVMDETPTWRTALLDLLGQTEPWEAADYGRRIFATTGSSDEYALALRNLAWSDRGDLTGELGAHFRGMISRSEWRQQPTRGFLEAFDIAVITGSVGELGGMVQGSAGLESAESRAAFVALDRIMLRDPDLLVEEFARNPSFLAQAPMHRASLLSRLDMRESTQAQFLANYLLRPGLSAEELEYFADLFPNGNRFTSNRLVTSAEPGGGIQEMKAVDTSAHRVLSAWLEEPRFAPRASELKRILLRLDSYLQAGSEP